MEKKLVDQVSAALSDSEKVSAGIHNALYLIMHDQKVPRYLQTDLIRNFTSALEQCGSCDRDPPKCRLRVENK